jgi:hypothetical protein
MKLSEFKKVVADIPAIYDDFDIQGGAFDGDYSIEDYSIFDNEQRIVLTP